MARWHQETRGKWDILMGGTEINNTLPGETTAGQNATEEDPMQELL